MAHSANQLLTLARADPAANMAAKNQAVDLNAIVSEVAAKFFDRALQADIDLGIDAEPATVHADPSLLEHNQLYFNAARLDRSLAISSGDFIRVANPRLATVAER